MLLKNLFKYKPKKHDIVKVNIIADRKKMYRLDIDIPHEVVSVDYKKKEVVVVKVGFEEDRGVEGWTLFFSDIEPYSEIQNLEG